MRLQNKRALITAAGQGIGRASAIAFAREGAEVLATDVNPAALAALQAEGISGLKTSILDVTDPHAFEAVRNEAAPFNVLFNCAGVVHAGSVLASSEQDWEKAWQLNVASMVHLCRAILPGMIAAGGGSIINMSSVASSIKGVADRCVYATTKAAVIGLTKSIAADYVRQGIRCNAICPGTVETPSLGERIQTQAKLQASDASAVRAAFIARQPMGRLGRADEIAALAVYLASEESSFTTGVAHIVDGGWSI
jgi:2-keto-3-deoxy-L-fuconate dehydrogenase